MVTANSRPKLSIGPMRWTVPSATHKAITYEVTADTRDGRLICNCPAQRGHRTCWHIRAVAAGMAGKPRIRVTVPAPKSTRPQPVGALTDADLY